MNSSEDIRYGVIIPAYHEEAHIADVVKAVKAYSPHVIVVDDGSTDGTAAAAREAGAEVIVHEINKGKGAALNTGYAFALAQEYEFVITMDADGQHAPQDLETFVAAYRESGAQVLVGSRMEDPKGMPWVRKLTNRFMSWLLSRKMGQRVPDTQSGFRLYHRDVLPMIPTRAAGFAAESEVLLELAARNVKIGSVPIQIIYGDEESKIHPIRDTIRFFSMLWKWTPSGADGSDNP